MNPWDREHQEKGVFGIARRQALGLASARRSLTQVLRKAIIAMFNSLTTR
jgi:hypothetical protein